MADILDKEARSARMAKVRQANTAPELALRRGLHAMGFRYSLHPKALPGRPDITLPKYRVAIFVHGCFWHGHDCRAGRPPSSNVAYWQPKIEANRDRDERKAAALRGAGWRVLVVWGCELRTINLGATVKRVADVIRGGQQ